MSSRPHISPAGIPGDRTRKQGPVRSTRSSQWVSGHRPDKIPTDIPVAPLYPLDSSALRGSQAEHNTLRPIQNGRHFADDIFKCIFLNENIWIPIKISLKFVPQGPINNIPPLVQIMAWRRPGDKPLSGPMMVKLPTHICVTRPQWVKTDFKIDWKQCLDLCCTDCCMLMSQWHRLTFVGMVSNKYGLYVLMVYQKRTGDDEPRIIWCLPVSHRVSYVS